MQRGGINLIQFGYGNISENYWTATLPGTNSSHLNMDGWKTILSFLLGPKRPIFDVLVGFREGCPAVPKVFL